MKSRPLLIAAVSCGAALLAFDVIKALRPTPVEHEEAFAEGIAEGKARMKRDILEGKLDSDQAEQVRERFFSDMDQSLGLLADTELDEQKRFALIMQDFMAVIAERARVWHAGFARINNSETLDFAALREEGAFARRREAIQAHETSTRAYLVVYDGLVDELRGVLAPLGPSNDFARGAIKGMIEQRTKTNAAMHEVLAAHVRFSADLQATLDYLELHFEAWEPIDGAIQFETSEQVDGYRALVDRLRQSQTDLDTATRRLVELS
ncbi:hypothetical protein ASA1KI_40310 [Opitutales bacterium ASA1]|uniref:hypothetical protein n=1 Tax=Congregicoccus parvus TaxID=3081749 RepID=UPI002B2B883D|nr:hypothetical protein ASA1KI_40310 [Opitutales bacterium ASA1]